MTTTAAQSAPNLSARLREALLSHKTCVVVEPEPDMDPERALAYLRYRLPGLRTQLRKVKDRMCFTHSGADLNTGARLWIDESLLCILCGARNAETGGEILRGLQDRYSLKPYESGTIRLRRRPLPAILDYFSREAGDWFRHCGSYPQFAIECLDQPGEMDKAVTHCRYRIARLEDLHYNPRRLPPGVEPPPVPPDWPYTPERWAEIQTEIEARRKEEESALYAEVDQDDERE